MAPLLLSTLAGPQPGFARSMTQAVDLLLKPQFFDFQLFDGDGVRGRSVLFVVESAVDIGMLGTQRGNMRLKGHEAPPF